MTPNKEKTLTLHFWLVLLLNSFMLLGSPSENDIKHIN